jgi:hypothetical protein
MERAELPLPDYDHLPLTGLVHETLHGRSRRRF